MESERDTRVFKPGLSAQESCHERDRDTRDSCKFAATKPLRTHPCRGGPTTLRSTVDDGRTNLEAHDVVPDIITIPSSRTRTRPTKDRMDGVGMGVCLFATLTGVHFQKTEGILTFFLR